MSKFKLSKLPKYSSSGSSRVADMNGDMVDAVNMLANMLKATPIVQAGDELGSLEIFGEFF